MKKTVITATAAEMKELVKMVKAAETKAELNEVIIEVSEIFPKDLLNQYKGTNALKGAMLDILDEVEIAEAKPKVEKLDDIEVFYDAIRTVCASNKSADYKVDLISRLIASYEEEDEATPIVKEKKPAAAPVKPASKPVAKAEPETPSRLSIVEKYMLEKDGDWFCIEDLCEEVGKYYDEEVKEHTIRSYMADSKLGKKYEFGKTNNGHQWYRIAKVKKVA